MKRLLVSAMVAVLYIVSLSSIVVAQDRVLPNDVGNVTPEIISETITITESDSRNTGYLKVTKEVRYAGIWQYSLLPQTVSVTLEGAYGPVTGTIPLVSVTYNYPANVTIATYSGQIWGKW